MSDYENMFDAFESTGTGTDGRCTPPPPPPNW